MNFGLRMVWNLIKPQSIQLPCLWHSFVLAF
uniref:Uncharacterized protein n=1 Tax=Populus trichocarpa TaxID=3694 RepID=A0A3N7EWW0_POPTR